MTMDYCCLIFQTVKEYLFYNSKSLGGVVHYETLNYSYFSFEILL